MSTCPPTALTCEQWRQRLCDAENARHALLTGVKTQSVTYGDMQTTYTQANIGSLEGYIQELRGEVDTACGGCSRKVRRSIQFIPR